MVTGAVQKPYISSCITVSDDGIASGDSTGNLIILLLFFAQAGKRKHGMAVGRDRLLVENLVKHEEVRIGGY
jgi:hypothetical protein